MYSPSGHLSPVDNSTDIAFTKEMGLTHADFFRYLPAAMGEHEYEVVQNRVSAKLGDGTVEITIGEQQERRIALMRIPFAEVSFLFRGVSEQQRQAFQAYFDLRFQRGGG